MDYFFHKHWQQKKLQKTEQKKKDENHLCWLVLKFWVHEMLKSYFKSYFILALYEIY